MQDAVGMTHTFWRQSARVGHIDRSVGWRLQVIVLQAGFCFVVETITSPILILTPLLLE
jgi:hypothetical protein